MNGKKLLAIGFVFALSGVVLPLFMILKIIPSSLWLAFLTQALSVSGLFLGLIGAATYVKERR